MSVGPAAEIVLPRPGVPAHVSRTPLYFESQGAWLFAWLHCAGPPRGQHGIVLCPPLGHEQLHSHRSWRHLAEALAEAGFAVLRFDYHGTGDSAGDDEDANRVATWLANVRSAMRWLRDQLGCAELSLVGLRFGTAIAAQIAEEEPVADLVLWAPVIKGRAYVREMKALSAAAGTPAQTGSGLEPAGFVLTEQTLQDMAGIDLLQARPRCRRLLLLERDDMPSDPKLLDQLRSAGIAASQVVSPGYAGMMAEPHFTTVPTQAITEITAWMRAGSCAVHSPIPVPPAQWPGTAVVTSDTGVPIRECAVQLSAQLDLFAILSEAVNPVVADVPAIVLLNAGAAYRVGPNRLYIMLARRLAARGFRCLRLDICGIGDSVNADPSRENDPYTATAFRDIDLAVKCLQREHGVQRVILLGLCSGAYAAFQSAAQLADRAIVECVIINPLTYYWREGMQMGSAGSVKVKAYNDAMAYARQPVKWLKLLTGRSKLGILGVFRVLLERWQLKRRLRQQAQQARADAGCSTIPSHPLHDDLPGDLTRIARTGRVLTFFFARSDPGYDMLTLAAGRQVEAMCQTGQIGIHFIKDADHTFSRRAPREAFLEAVVAALCGRYVTAQAPAMSPRYPA